ncbi:MAG: metal ABC transporter substrate-binding protein [Spirochaetota bacterium]|nr:metal ABC transporter substrate-binding protein [Spirochaetota bacterium]
MKIKLIFLIMSILLISCQSENKSNFKNQKIKVMSSIYPIADLVRNIVGEKEAICLMPTGADPHSFEPTPNTLKQLRDVKIFFFIGGDFDNWILKLVQSAHQQEIKLINLINRIDVKMLKTTTHKHDHHDHASEHTTESHVDPHIWLDPLIMKEIVNIIVRELKIIDPTNAKKYEENGENYKLKLEKLHQEIDREVSTFKQKSYISFHGAFQYFANRYSLHEIAVIEPIPGKEPSIKWLKNVISKAKKLNVKNILAEPQIDPKLARILAKELNGNVIIADPIEISTDSSKTNYIELMKYNLMQFKKMLKN